MESIPVFDEKRKKAFACGPLFSLLWDLQVDVSDSADELEEKRLIVCGILNLIDEKCAKDDPGISQIIHTHIVFRDREEQAAYVVDHGRVRPSDEVEIAGIPNERRGPTYRVCSIGISIIGDVLFLDEVYGPLFGRGSRCSYVIHNGTAFLDNPRVLWVF